ncbi:MAG TPA: thioredoxin domain-containing protein [Candidatus Paceibacterota bacterium]|nr:thioredoxin domain-containing protein [Candidatus Paceibacterota bacterium]
MQNNAPKQIAGSILLAALIVAGAILLKDKTPNQNAGPVAVQGAGTNTQAAPAPAAAGTSFAPIAAADHTLGNPNAKVAVVMYEDFQCPFCGRFFSDSEKVMRDNYVTPGKVLLVYRHYAFLGPESTHAAEASECAAEQGKFWQYHDYLFSHQNGENKGAFADANLEAFAGTLGLDTSAFDSCFNSDKYANLVDADKSGGSQAGVQGTPKGFILVNGKVVDTIDGAQPSSVVTQKLDAVLAE